MIEDRCLSLPRFEPLLLWRGFFRVTFHFHLPHIRSTIKVHWVSFFCVIYSMFWARNATTPRHEYQSSAPIELCSMAITTIQS